LIVSDAESEKAIRQNKRDFEQKKNRSAAIDNIIRRLYEDNVAGKVSDERFFKMSAEYELEQSTLIKEIAELEIFLQEQRERAVSTDSFLKLVRKYTDIKDLTQKSCERLLRGLLSTKRQKTRTASEHSK
jgi:hypothetical protein